MVTIFFVLKYNEFHTEYDFVITDEEKKTFAAKYEILKGI